MRWRPFKCNQARYDRIICLETALLSSFGNQLLCSSAYLYVFLQNGSWYEDEIGTADSWHNELSNACKHDTIERLGAEIEFIEI